MMAAVYSYEWYKKVVRWLNRSDEGKGRIGRHTSEVMLNGLVIRFQRVGLTWANCRGWPIGRSMGAGT